MVIPFMSKVTHAQLDWNAQGTPVSEHFDDVYFSNVDGLEETRYVFLQQNDLPHRWDTFSRRNFVIAETGFGTGLNFLATWQAFEQWLAAHPQASMQSLHFISFEKYPVLIDDLIKAHESWPALSDYAKALQENYPLATSGCHRIILANGSVTLDLWFGDIHDTIPTLYNPAQGLVDAWYLDGFAPSKNPDMWRQSLFDMMGKLAKPDATCATFTAAGFVRRGLIEAGFAMQKVKGFGTKREMIRGTYQGEKPSNSALISPFELPTPTQTDDVAIIGGGIASAALADALISRGIKVTVFCQDSVPASNASGNRQGAIYPLLNAQHDVLSQIFANAFIFARHKVKQWAQTLAFDHAWCGVTQLMWDEKARSKLSHLTAAEFPSDLVHPLTEEQTKVVAGLDMGCESVHYPLGGWLAPRQLTQALLECLDASEYGSCYYNSKVVELTSIDQGWQLTFENGETQNHKTVVVANGHQVDEFSQTANLPLGKVKGQVSHIPTTPELAKLNNVLCYDGYLTPENPNNHYHCIGASYDRTHIDQHYDANAQQENAQKLAHCIVDKDWVAQVDISEGLSRQGIRCVSRDHLPFVGPLADPETIIDTFPHHQDAYYDNLFVIAGLGSRGLTSAPLMAEYLASMLAGDPLPLSSSQIERVHPNRMWLRKLIKGKTVSLSKL
jgi:tRNA 5-methylaminomethyl-2-thiouridine biosynthesis bifunctional protein